MSKLEFSNPEVLMQHVDQLRAGQRTAKHGEKGHLHYNEQGYWVRCYHRCRTQVLSVGFWVGLTLGFPFEHFLWMRVPGFSWLTHLLGL